MKLLAILLLSFTLLSYKPHDTGCQTRQCDKRVDAKRRKRKMHFAVASWYDDSGTTASGTHYTTGFASLLFGNHWGKRIRFCYGSRCIVGRLDDHGPYVSGRLFDLGVTLHNVLHCDLCTLRWRPA